jgi:hypothetical protein
MTIRKREIVERMNSEYHLDKYLMRPGRDLSIPQNLKILPSRRLATRGILCPFRQQKKSKIPLAISFP